MPFWFTGNSNNRPLFELCTHSEECLICVTRMKKKFSENEHRILLFYKLYDWEYKLGIEWTYQRHCSRFCLLFRWVSHSFVWLKRFENIDARDEAFQGADQENVFINSVNDAPMIELGFRPSTDDQETFGTQGDKLHFSSLELCFRRKLLENIWWRNCIVGTIEEHQR